MVQFRLVGLRTPDDVLLVFITGEEICFWETTESVSVHDTLGGDIID